MPFRLSWKHREKITLFIQRITFFSEEFLKFVFSVFSGYLICSWLSSAEFLLHLQLGKIIPILKRPERREPWVGREAESKHISHLWGSWKKITPATDVSAPLPTRQ